jgi:hypothetical protein
MQPLRDRNGKHACVPVSHENALDGDLMDKAPRADLGRSNRAEPRTWQRARARMRAWSKGKQRSADGQGCRHGKAKPDGSTRKRSSDRARTWREGKDRGVAIDQQPKRAKQYFSLPCEMNDVGVDLSDRWEESAGEVLEHDLQGRAPPKTVKPTDTANARVFRNQFKTPARPRIIPG